MTLASYRSNPIGVLHKYWARLRGRWQSLFTEASDKCRTRLLHAPIMYAIQVECLSVLPKQKSIIRLFNECEMTNRRPAGSRRSNLPDTMAQVQSISHLKDSTIRWAHRAFAQSDVACSQNRSGIFTINVNAIILTCVGYGSPAHCELKPWNLQNFTVAWRGNQVYCTFRQHIQFSQRLHQFLWAICVKWGGCCLSARPHEGGKRWYT